MEFVATTTNDSIAPDSVIYETSCSCKGSFDTNRCTCHKNKIVCIDFCGCGDHCENTDPSLSIEEMDDDEIDEEGVDDD